jgi:uncharacterized protein YdeI (YjbR/CyaY-like superfamily)
LNLQEAPMTTDPRIDDFIVKAAPFAQPILKQFRAVVHVAVPEAVETIKWGMPHFTMNGKILAGMAAFKAHAALMVEGAGERRGMEGGGMGNYGKLKSIDEMPADAELTELLQTRAANIRSGAKVAKPKPAPKAEISAPEDFLAALTAKGRETFDAFAPSHRREYLEWIVEAKRPETRAKRIAQAAEWLATGKKRNWKYEDC